MKFLSKLPLVQKLVVLAMIPLMVMMGFGLYQSYLTVQLRIKAGQLEDMVGFSVRASNLVHEMQKERGMTAGLIGSKGVKFADKIVIQRELVDEKLNILKDYLLEFDASSISPLISVHIDGALEGLKPLVEIRNAVSGLTLPLGEALGFYTRNNAAFLAVIAEMSSISPRAENATMISAYANYLQSKERAGIERAVLANTFAKDHFTGNLFDRFKSLVVTQNNYINVFKSLANKESLQFYEDTMQGEFITETERMRNIAASSNARTKIVNQLNRTLGYGGLIHQFKNYVLRGSDKYLVSLSDRADKAYSLFEDYKQLSVAKATRKDLDAIEGVVRAYHDAALQVRDMKRAGVDIGGIDSSVKISDGPALDAITRLSVGSLGVDPSYWFKMQTGKINLLKEVEDRLAQNLDSSASDLIAITTSNLVVTLTSMLLGLIASIWISTWLARGILKQIGGEPSSIEQVANRVAAGDLQVDESTAATGVFAAIIAMQNQLSNVIENEIARMVNDARQGNLSGRIETKDKSGFYRTLAEGVNDIVDSSEAIITDTQRVFSSLAQGDLSQHITRDYQGSYNQLKQDANETIDRLNRVITGDIQKLVDDALKGQLDSRIDLSDKQGFFRDMSERINQLVDSIANIFRDASDAMERVAGGDLTETIQKTYSGDFEELKQNINKTILHLDKTVTELHQVSSVMASTTSEIADGNNSLSSRTESQAAALEETSASMAELTGTVKNNAENTLSAGKLAGDARNSAQLGAEIMGQASEAMEAINDSSQKIAEIIGVIDEIAFQTNLLALNASVEAARAGDQGRGFAVVATEVRNLAGRSASSAKEIKDLINDSVAKVEVGVGLVNRSSESLDEIAGHIKTVGNIVEEITVASKEQSEGIEQVNLAVGSMDETTQQNAALAEETSAAALSLSEDAVSMNKLVGFFTISSTMTEPEPLPKTQAGTGLHVVENATSTDKSDGMPVAKDLQTQAKKPVAANAVIIDESDEWEEF